MTPGSTVQGILSRYELRYGSPFPFREGALLEKTASIFSMSAQSNEMMQERGREVLRHIESLPSREQDLLLDEIAEHLPRASFSLTGVHNYLFFPLVARNVIEGENIFSPTALPALVSLNPVAFGSFLKENCPFYGNPYDVQDFPVSRHVPSLVLDFPARGSYRWLDVGSGLKAEGPPGLLLVKEGLDALLDGVDFDYVGTDIFLPPLHFDGGRVRSNKVAYDAFFSHGRIDLHGISACNATFPENDVRSDEFNHGRFDFISMAFVLPSMIAKGEAPSLCHLVEGLEWFDPAGGVFDKEPKFLITATQKDVLGRLLASLEIQGLFFLQLMESPGWKQVSPSYHYRNISSHLIIQRTEESRYRLYSQVLPILFDGVPGSLARFVSSPDRGEGHFPNIGLADWCPGPEGGPNGPVSGLLAAADDLAFRYQTVHHSQWLGIHHAVTVINGRGRVDEVLRTYLASVPDDEPVKGLLLKAGRELSDRIDTGRG